MKRVFYKIYNGIFPGAWPRSACNRRWRWNCRAATDLNIRDGTLPITTHSGVILVGAATLRRCVADGTWCKVSMMALRVGPRRPNLTVFSREEAYVVTENVCGKWKSNPQWTYEDIR